MGSIRGTPSHGDGGQAMEDRLPVKMCTRNHTMVQGCSGVLSLAIRVTRCIRLIRVSRVSRVFRVIINGY